jgi:hypothetical protein
LIFFLNFFCSFATYLELDRLYLSCENQDEVHKEAARKMTSNGVVKHRLFNELLRLVKNKVWFITANGYASLGPRG